MSDEVIQQKDKDDEISLLDLFAVLLRWKWLIMILTGLACVAVVIVCIISIKLPPEKSFLPNKYTPRAQMLINDKDSSGSSLSSVLSSSGLGSLASMAGVNVSGGGVTYSALASYLVGSHTIQDAVVQEFNLIDRYKIEQYPIASSRKALSKNLSASFDDKTGVFTVSFTDRDPVLLRQLLITLLIYLKKDLLKLALIRTNLQLLILKKI